jgi:uncharacterized membrane protein
MSSQSSPSRDSPDPAAATESLSDHIHQNIDSIAEFHQREHQKIGAPQRWLEAFSSFLGRPLYLLALLSLIGLWLGENGLGRRLGLPVFDPPPFTWLQVVLTLAALITTTVVLIAQNRQAKLENQRAHLDLQVNLLTEQKVTKLIHLLEELRRDLPMVKNRHDPEAAELQMRTDTAKVLSALEEVGVASEGKGAVRP